MSANPVLVLASQSPQRSALLARAGLSFTVRPASIDETEAPGETPEDYVCRVALDKGRAVATALGAAAEHQPWVILAADTTVWLSPEGPPLGKAADRAQAQATLSTLFDAPHHYVSTGIAVGHLSSETSAGSTGKAGLTASDNRFKWRGQRVTTKVILRPPSRAAFERYLDGGDWRDRAGAYAIQGDAAAFVRRIEGSFTNVVGLPLAETLDLLAPFDLETRPVSL